MILKLVWPNLSYFAVRITFGIFTVCADNPLASPDLYCCISEARSSRLRELCHSASQGQNRSAQTAE